MPTLTTRQVLDEFIAEIERTDPEMLPPPQERKGDEKVITIISDDLIKKVFSLSTFYRREGRRLQVDVETVGPTPETQGEFHLLKCKHEILSELTWYLLRSHYGHWDEGIGIRKGWEMVSIPDDDEKPIAGILSKKELPKFLRKLLEDLND
jgi:hypothetical protein